jgi:hypothetical protein
VTVLTAHSRIVIDRALLTSGHWSGIRHGVRLDMRLEENLMGRMIVCTIGSGKKKQQVTGETMFEVGNALQGKFRRILA